MSVRESVLLQRLAAGDVGAFEALYDLHSASVHRFVWPLLQDREQTADVVQETFLVAWRRRRSIRLATETLLPWLLAIARFIAANELRRMRRHPAASIEQMVVLVDGPEAWAEARIELSRVLEEIGGLEKLDRAILQLCIFDGLTYGQAATRLHITPTAVGKRVERARKRLKKGTRFGIADEGNG